MENIPGMNWILTHPRLAAWAVLAIGMNGLLIFEARNVGLLPTQWIALVIATTLVAGACVWIISWEDEEDPDTVEAVVDDKAKEVESAAT